MLIIPEYLNTSKGAISEGCINFPLISNVVISYEETWKWIWFLLSTVSNVDELFIWTMNCCPQSLASPTLHMVKACNWPLSHNGNSAKTKFTKAKFFRYFGHGYCLIYHYPILPELIDGILVLPECWSCSAKTISRWCTQCAELGPNVHSSG